MNTLNGDYDEVLRRALHAAAESVEPSADGLERIRARLVTPPVFSLAALLGWYSDVAMRFGTWAEPVIGTVADLFWSAVDRFRPESSKPGHARPRFGWLRPVAAMGTAIFVVAAGAFAVLTLPQAISSSGSFFQGISGGGNSGSAAHPGSSAVQGSGSHLSTGGMPTAPSAGAPGTTPIASKCTALGTSKPGGGSPSPTVSLSPPPSTPVTSPPVTTSPPTTSPTTDPSSDPTPSTTPGPGSTGTPSPSSSSPDTSAAGATAATPASGADTTGMSAALAVSLPQSAVMLPAHSSSPAANPCPSKSPNKKKKHSPLALGSAGLSPVEVTESGASG